MPFIPISYDNTSDEEGRRLYKLFEVAAQIACSVSTMRREVRAGRLKVIRIGRILRVTEADLAAYLAARRKR